MFNLFSMSEAIRVSTNNFVYAAWYRRLGAQIIDILIVKGLVFLIFPGSLEIFTLMIGHHWADILPFLMSFDGMWLWFGMFAYLVIMQGVLSRTVGMIVLKTRVANTHGKKIGWLKAVFRTFGFFLSLIVLGLGLVPILFDKKRQALHDKLTKTIVIMKR